MNVPDYVSPIVACRAWQWDFACTGTSTPPLRSLNGEWWFPGYPLSAKCCVPVARRAQTVRDNHNAPKVGCMCGIYAAKSFDQLRRMGYDRRGICGEVNLWGTIVEHQFGWRAQFAYPKTLVLPFEIVLSGMNEVSVRLKALIAYGADILIDDGRRNVALWAKESGYDPAGLDLLRTRQLAAVARVAVLTTDGNGILLQNGVPAQHSAEIVFKDLRLPLKEADPIVRQIQEPQAKVVVIDLIPDTIRLARHVIRAIREANNQILVFARGARGETNPMDAAASMPFAPDTPDAYLARGTFDVQAAYIRLSLKRTIDLSMKRMKGWWKGGPFPPGGTGSPGGPPPPPAVPVYSPRGGLPRTPRPSAVGWAI